MPLSPAQIQILHPRKESAIQKEILLYLKARGVMAWKAGSGGIGMTYKGRDRFVKFGVKGQSDIIGVLPGGRFLALEVKRPGYIPTRQQQAFLLKVQSLGGVAAYVQNVAMVDRILEDEGVTVRLRQAFKEAAGPRSPSVDRALRTLEEERR